MGIVTVTGTERREFERNAIPMRTVDGTLVNTEAIQIKDIGNEKPNSSGYIRKLNEDFGWDTKISRHFEQQGQYENKKIHMLLGLKNVGAFFENVRAEQLGVKHPSHLPDIGIFRSILSENMIMAGRMGISEELVTSDLNLYVNDVKEMEENDIDLKEIDKYLDADMKLNTEEECPFYKNWDKLNYERHHRRCLHGQLWYENKEYR